MTLDKKNKLSNTENIKSSKKEEAQSYGVWIFMSYWTEITEAVLCNFFPVVTYYRNNLW